MENKLTEQEKKIAIESADKLFDDLFNKTKIRFIGSNIYKPYNGWQSMSGKESDELFVVLKKNKEFIVEGEEKYINQLKKLPSQHAWGLTFKEATNYLNSNKISWEIIYESDAATV
ncbi:MAG: hypothetical protein ABIP51_15695 [Bacteroidia bacterium]